MNSLKTRNLVLSLVGLIPFFIWLGGHLTQDPWWDEIISIKDYALSSFSYTTTNYPDPNNHIFLNLINSVYLSIIGQNDLYEVLDSIIGLRILQMLFAFTCVLYTYKIVHKFFNKDYSFISVAILASTIPFLNFSLQLRGYNLSMMFIVMLIYYAWSAMDEFKKRDYFILPFLIFALLYTLPSNIYLVFAFIPSFLFIWLRKFKWEMKNADKKNKSKNIKSVNQRFITIAVLSGLALLLTYLAYLPVMDNLLNNKFVTNTPRNKVYAITKLMPTILNHLLSARWLLLGFVVMLIIALTKRKYFFNYKFTHLCYLLFLPFIFIAIHQKQPFERTLVILVPIFAIILTLLIIRFLEIISIKNTWKFVIASSLVLYSVINANYELGKNDEILVENTLDGIREQNMYRNYYLASNFQPKKIAEKIKEVNPDKKDVLMLDELDRVSLTFYLNEFDIPSQAVVKVQKEIQIIDKQKMTHYGLVQRSPGKQGKISYKKIPCKLPNENELNEYYLLIGYNFNKKPNSEFLFLTGNNKKLKAVKENMKSFEFKKLGKAAYANYYTLKNSVKPSKVKEK